MIKLLIKSSIEIIPTYLSTKITKAISLEPSKLNNLPSDTSNPTKKSWWLDKSCIIQHKKCLLSMKIQIYFKCWCCFRPKAQDLPLLSMQGEKSIRTFSPSCTQYLFFYSERWYDIQRCRCWSHRSCISISDIQRNGINPWKEDSSDRQNHKLRWTKQWNRDDYT